MKRFYLLLFVPIVAGCATAPATQQPVTTYSLSLTDIERQQRGGGGETQQFHPTATNTFEDETIRIEWQPQESQFQFTLTNKTGASERVLWDDASFVGPDGKTDRIMHQGVKFADRSGSMPPTLIIHGATLDDLIAPVSNVYWREGYGTYDAGGWQSRPLLTGSPSATDARTDRSIRILLPIEANGVVREYLFDFAIGTTIGTAATPSDIKIVRKREEVANCRLLGDIAAHPPYIWPGDDLKQLRRKAAPLGADTILIPGYRIGVVEGFAYRCNTAAH